ncbi:MAG: Gfo/Idh/MocA family oxidoreductase [Clostridiales bacterium]|nr:Gfo/Idh/MocA family oxidoreductase [Clostridiales bacterium]
MAANPSLADAVYVCTNMSAHRKTTEMFLRAGIPVLCEKAFALNAAEARSMIECAKEHKTTLMEAMWCRFLPATRKVDEMMKKGEYGKIKHIAADFKAGWGHGPKSRVWRHDTGGGSVLDLAVYCATYAHMLLGKPLSVRAAGKIKNGVDKCCDFTFEYPGGVKADLHSSLQFPAIKEACKIECEKGTVIVPSFYGAKRIIEKPLGGKKKTTRFERIDGFTYEIKHFADLVRRKELESDIMPLSATLEVMELLDEINRQIGVVF